MHSAFARKWMKVSLYVLAALACLALAGLVIHGRGIGRGGAVSGYYGGLTFVCVWVSRLSVRRCCLHAPTGHYAVDVLS